MSMSEALRQRRSRWPATRHQEHRVSAAESITAGGADEREYAQDAVLAAQSYVQTGRRFVVDVDLEKFFDRVNHEANVLLDEVDKELQRLGHCFARYADDCNVYVHSRKAGERVMELLRSLHTRLHLTVNEAKSAVASVFGRKFLGYSLWMGAKGEIKRRVANKPMATFKQRIRQRTRRSGGRSMGQVVQRLRPYVLGWKAYF